MKHVAHLVELLDPRRRREMEESMKRAVVTSFAEDKRRAEKSMVKPLLPTTLEVQRRTRIVYDWFVVMRNELGYSTQHALDLLPSALRATLDDTQWEPPPAVRSWKG